MIQRQLDEPDPAVSLSGTQESFMAEFVETMIPVAAGRRLSIAWTDNHVACPICPDSTRKSILSFTWASGQKTGFSGKQR